MMKRTCASGSRILIGALLLSAVVTSPFHGVTAQEATPEPEPIAADIPSPQECEIEPRNLPLLPELATPGPPATPAPLAAVPAEPFVLPTGEAPDEATVEAVTATVRESLACRNANDLLRAYALFTPNMLEALFGGPDTIDPDVRALIAEEQGPVERRGRVALVQITEMVLLPDGRTGALVLTANAERIYQDYLYFAQDSDSERWLIDGAENLGWQALGG
jgi:hypothetical protein